MVDHNRHATMLVSRTKPAMTIGFCPGPRDSLSEAEAGKSTIATSTDGHAQIPADDWRAHPVERPMGNKTSVVFVVDNDVMVRCAMTSWLAGVGIPAQESSSIAELLTFCDKATPGCIVFGKTATEDHKPDSQTMTTLRQHRVPIVQIVEQGDVAGAVRACRQGVAEVLEAPLSGEALIDAVRSVMQGSELLQQRSNPGLEVAIRLSRLSKREREVLWYIVAGRTIKNIAGILGIARRTADFHRSSVLRKMQAESVAQLTCMVVDYRNGLMGNEPPFEDKPFLGKTR